MGTLKKKFGSKKTEDAKVKAPVVNLPPPPPDSELEKKFIKLLEELEVPLEAREGMSKTYSSGMKWTFINEHLTSMKEQSKKIEATSDIRDSPMYFMQKLEAEPDLKTLAALKSALLSETLPWVNKFRELGGVVALFRLISMYEIKPEKSKDDINSLINCVLSLKGIMNTKSGLEAVRKFPKAVEKIMLILDVDSARLRNAIFEMLATITVIGGKESHSSMIEALEQYQQQKRTLSRFSILVDILKYDSKSEDPAQLEEVKMNCLTFINCLINIPDSLAEREEIRSEFDRLKLKGVLKSKISNTEDVNLKEQIKTFNTDAQIDDEAFKSLLSLPKSSVLDPHEIVKQLQKKDSNSYLFGTIFYVNNEKSS